MFYDDSATSTHFDNSNRQWWWFGYLLCCLTCDYVGLNAQNIAFQKDSSGFVAIIGYMIIFYGFLADYFIFGFTINGVQIAAALLILGVTVGTSVYKLKQKQSEQQQQQS